MRVTARGLLAPCVAAALAWSAVPAAAAQERDTVSQDTVVRVYNLEGITVTVTRVRSEVNRVPYSVHVLDRNVVQRGEATVGLEESLAEVAGVWVNNRYNLALGSRVSMRGFGARAQFGVRGVKLLLDGIPLTLPDGQSQLNNLDLASVGRVEVIRGPASSLYGNAAGGVVHFLTEEPPAVLAQPELGLLWGSYGDGRTFQKYTGEVGGRYDRFDYVASVSHFRTEGFRQRSEAQTTVVNGRARLALGGATELSAVWNLANTPVAQNPGALPADLARVRPDTAWPANVARRTGESARQMQGGLGLRHRASAEWEVRGSLWGIARDLDNPIPPRIIRVDRAAGGARVEAEWTPVGLPVSGLVAGVEAEMQADDRIEFANVNGAPGDTTLWQDERVRSLAAFAQGAVRLADAWELTLGARYDAVRFEVDDRFFDDGDNSGARTMDAVSPMVGLRYTPVREVNLYANLTYAFETPTTTELKNSPDGVGGFNNTLEPQKAWGTEWGVKGAVGDRFDYAVAGYCAWVRDELIPFEIDGRSFFRNAGRSRHCGAEVQTGWLLAEGLTAALAYTFSDFAFTDYVVGGVPLDGNRLPGVPVHQAHGRLFYRSPANLYGAVELTYADSYFTDDANTARNPSYTVVDLRLGYAGRRGRWAAEPFVGINNVFDVRYNASVTINAFGGRYYEPAPGRTVYAGLRMPVRVGP